MRKKILLTLPLILIALVLGIHYRNIHLNKVKGILVNSQQVPLTDYTNIELPEGTTSDATPSAIVTPSTLSQTNKTKNTVTVSVTLPPTITPTTVITNESHSDTKSGIQKNISINYYDIHGSTENDLREQMNNLGPSDSSGRYDAFTKWNIYWSKICNGKASVSVEIIYTYPKWQMPANPNPALVSKWNTYMEALNDHESGHGDIALSASQEILDTITNLPNTNNCLEQNNQVISLGNDVIEKYKNEEVQYDNSTDHGGTQGAYFP